MSTAIANLALVRSQGSRGSQACLWRKQQVMVRTPWGKIENLTLSIRQLNDKIWHVRATLRDLTIDQIVRGSQLKELTAICFVVDWTPKFSLPLEQPLNLAS